MFTGHDKRSDSNARADLHLLIHGLPLRSAGGKDAAHFPAVTRGEELQTCSGIISQECFPPQPSCCYLLGRGRRDRQQNLLLFRDTCASSPSREQLLANSFCSGAAAGRGGVNIGATTHWPALGPEPQVRKTEREFLTLVPNLWRTREQLRASCSLHCHLGQKGSLRKLRTGFSC